VFPAAGQLSFRPIGDDTYWDDTLSRYSNEINRISLLKHIKRATVRAAVRASIVRLFEIRVDCLHQQSLEVQTICIDDRDFQDLHIQT